MLVSLRVIKMENKNSKVVKAAGLVISAEVLPHSRVDVAPEVDTNSGAMSSIYLCRLKIKILPLGLQAL